jgi:predicted DNA-binding transcriptional regulator YafY
MKPRSPLNIFKLVMMLQGSKYGITLNNIEEEFECSRRTAQRMLSDVHVEIPPDQWIEKTYWGEPKRWRIEGQPLRVFMDLTATELDALNTSINYLRANGQEATADDLSSLETKVRNFAVAKEDWDNASSPFKKKSQNKIGSSLAKEERDAENLAELKGYALRPGPRFVLEQNHIETIEAAIAATQVLYVAYHEVGHNEPAVQNICPFGFLIGRFTYLIAFPNRRPKAMRLYRMDQFSSILALDTIFKRPINITIEDVVAKSFGAEIEEPRRIKWRFSAKASKEAEKFQFHPSQKVKKLSNGKLDVEFTAGGLKEMCWELFQWGDSVEILEPRELKEEMVRQLSAASRISG